MTWNSDPPANASLDDHALLLPTRRSSNAMPLSPPSMQLSAPVSPSSQSTHGDSPTLSLPLNNFPAPTSQRNGSTTNKLFGIFFLIICTCGIGLVSVSSLLQGSDVLGGSSTVSLTGKAASTQLAADTQHIPGLRRGGSPDNSMNPSDPTNPTSPTPTISETPTSSNELAPATPGTKLPVQERWKRLGNLEDYECVAWRPCKDCTPAGAVDMVQSLPCNASIANGVAGFCEIRHKTTKLTQRVMEMHCDSLRPGVAFKCEDFAEILSYGKRASAYVHDPSFSYEQCRKNFQTDQLKANKAPMPLEVKATPDAFFKRGLVIVVYEKLLESVFASIKSMRQQGCSLPIELWYMTSETDTNQPILRTLTSEYGVYLREITDARASRFYTKIYAVFYSAFDQVLLLDADNFAVRDPTYLFASTEFETTGAIFWPDFWRFKKTIFNIQPTSFVWDVFDLDPVDMFEQESGQVLIDRRRHLPAMNVMMYYAFHPTLIEKMRLVWGDKDLFRFAWMKTQSSFHMIQMPPGSAGVKLPDRNVFCGVTMVQHDTNGDVIFLHRNQEKLTSDNRRIVWQDLQQFKLGDVSLDDYDVRGANGGRYYPTFKRCYGKDIYYERAFNVQPVSETSFAGLEVKLLDFIQEAARIANPQKTTETPTPSTPQ